MLSIVIPAKNEAEQIHQTLNNCTNLPVDLIIPILNGCTDMTKAEILAHPLKSKIHLIEFSEPLGIDIPRAVGAAYAYKHNSQAVLFLDGDMRGNITSQLQTLLDGIINNNIDMALTNCYPYITYRPLLASTVISYREKLNRHLGVFADLGLANPCHGPHAVSKKLLEKIPWRALALPPLSLAMAVYYNLKVKVVTSIPHNYLLSSRRDDDHNTLIAETIIGDCIEALNFLQGLPAKREYNGIFYLGYQPERRFDLLEKFIQSLELDKG